MTHFRFLTRLVILCILGLAITACSGTTKPTIVLVSPPHGSQFREGEDVAFQSTSTDSAGVTRVELVVDGAVVRTDSPPGAQAQQTFTLVQTWKATQGTHAVSLRAYNASSTASDPAAISITVAAAVVSTSTTPTTAAPTSPPPTAVPPTAVPPTAAPCTNNSTYVADVTVPDGTTLALGQTFNKIWRVRNTGSCTWGAGYLLVFVGGEAMGATTSIAVPNTAPNATADLLVPMTAPTTPGAHSGQWRLKSSGGTLFGTAVTVVINVIDTNQPAPNPAPVTPPPPNQPSGCSGSPSISSFTSNDYDILKNGSATLSWGEVTNADSVEIDQGIGGVGTPGSATVSPASTTTYTMTAHCGSNTATKQVTIQVSNILIPILPILVLKVTDVNISYDDLGFQNAACGYKHYRANGKITTNRFGDVKYRWERSGVIFSVSQTLHFDAAATQSVPDLNFTPTASNKSGTLRLHVTEPDGIYSNTLNWACIGP